MKHSRTKVDFKGCQVQHVFCKKDGVRCSGGGQCDCYTQDVSPGSFASSRETFGSLLGVLFRQRLTTNIISSYSGKRMTSHIKSSLHPRV